MGSLGEEEQMKQTPNVQRPPPNLEISLRGATSNIKHRTSNILWRIVGLVIAGIFIYAGAIKTLDPAQFASDIDNYKILPWPIRVALPFYLPSLEIFCVFALIVPLFYLVPL